MFVQVENFVPYSKLKMGASGGSEGHWGHAECRRRPLNFELNILFCSSSFFIH